MKFAPQHQVAQDAAVVGRSQDEGTVQVQARRDGVRYRAHSTDALSVRDGVARVAPDHDDLEATEHSAVALGRDHLLLAANVVHGYFDFQMPFDAGHGIDGYGLHDRCSQRSALGFWFVAALTRFGQMLIEWGHPIGEVRVYAPQTWAASSDAPVDPVLAGTVAVPFANRAVRVGVLALASQKLHTPLVAQPPLRRSARHSTCGG